MIRYRTIQIKRSAFLFEWNAEVNWWTLVHTCRNNEYGLLPNWQQLHEIANSLPDDRGVATVIDYRDGEPTGTPS